jgi:DNA-binding response OmpR family regulator
MSSAAQTFHTILVVEPDVVIRLVLAEYLRECGFKVYEAVSAEEAHYILDASDRHVDVVFADVRLPGPMDGFGLSQWMRQHHPGVSMILTSGKEKAAERAGDLCEQGPLEKPYEPQEALRRINLLLERQRSATKP